MDYGCKSHTAKQLLGCLVSGYRLNELVRACRVCCVDVRARRDPCMFVLFFFLSRQRDTVVRWLVAGGGRSNSLAETNSVLTSQRCHMLVLAHSPQWASLKANQLARLTPGLSTYLPPPPFPRKVTLNFFFFFPLSPLGGF